MLLLEVLVIFCFLPHIFSSPTDALSSLLRREEEEEPFAPPAGCESACQAFPDNRVTAGVCFDIYTVFPETVPDQSCCAQPVFSSFHDCAACLARVQPDSIDLPSADSILTNFNAIINQCNKGGEHIPALSLFSSGQNSSASNDAITSHNFGIHATIVGLIVALSILS